MNRLFNVFLLLTILVGLGEAQYKKIPPLSGIGLPYFEARIIKMLDSTELNYHLLMEIKNDDLSYIKEDSIFHAGVEISISAIQDGAIVLNDYLAKDYYEKVFEFTNSRKKKHIIQREVKLDPGDYIIIITLKDKNSNQFVKRKLKLTVENSERAKWTVSDLVFFDKVEKKKDQIIPLGGPNVQLNFATEASSIYCRFNTYIPDTMGVLLVKFDMVDADGLHANTYSYSVEKVHPFMTHWIKINRDQLSKSQYQVNLEIQYNESKKIKSSAISFFWTDAPVTVENLDEALKQLRYIAPSDSLKKYKNAPFEEKKMFFEKFWKKFDPDPKTSINELKDEYFKRVNFANQHFSTTGIKGWLSDRGRILIKFGQPDEVYEERIPINRRPYEIWRYHKKNREFLFIKNSFGDYELHPDYINVEYE